MESLGPFNWQSAQSSQDIKILELSSIRLFQEVCQLVENRRRELMDSVRMMRDEKRKVLRDQMESIDAHRKK